MSRPATQTWPRVAAAYFPMLMFGALGLSLTWGGFWYLAPACFALLIVPALDLAFGEDNRAFAAQDFGPIQTGLMRAAPGLFVILNAAALVHVAKAFATLSLSEQAAATFSFGVMGSIAITAAHELVHKQNPAEKLFGRLGLLCVGYMHFEINHIEGHHINACTAKDESTGWLGEGAFSYFFRTIPGCYRLSWDIEARRLKRRNCGVISAHNRMLYFLPLPVVLSVALWIWVGPLSAAFYAVQAIIAVIMLESVAFIEHYGLLRPIAPTGESGRMTSAHSWNAPQRFSGYLTFSLQRHADHHALASKPYFLLKPNPESPQLPFGYPVMITLAFIPPLWRAVMDPRLAMGGGPINRYHTSSVETPQ